MRLIRKALMSWVLQDFPVEDIRVYLWAREQEDSRNYSSTRHPTCSGCPNAHAIRLHYRGGNDAQPEHAG